MADSGNWPSDGPQHRRNRLVAVRAPIPVLLGAVVALALPAAAAAAPTTPALSLPTVAIKVPGPYPPLSGLGIRPSGDLSLGWHGPPPPKAVTTLPGFATTAPGPYPPLSGLGNRPGGELSLGWHGAPPATATAKRAVARASHRRHQRAASGW
jgi:hypothetical protein